MPYMLDEIESQPAALEQFLEREAEPVARLAESCREREIELIYIAARGTSDHAAVYAKYLFEITTGLPVCLAAPSVFTLYGAELRLEKALILGISQSGAAADAGEILQTNRRLGRLTACITNHPDSPMGAAAEYVIDCRAGEERSLPATKTYTASLAAVASLAAEYARDGSLAGALRGVPTWLREVIGTGPGIACRVERYRYMEECFVLGRGYNQCTALETALKLTETSYVRASPYSAADFLHGPIASVGEGMTCLLFAPGGRALAPMADLARRLREQRAELIVVSDADDLLGSATTPFRVPSVPEPVSPLVAVCVGQLFACHLALVKGRDPDRPRGLKKVTLTR
jgi:glucosamine--fructose-6-phosphate aminotransferase (isomerizing)